MTSTDDVTDARGASRVHPSSLAPRLGDRVSSEARGVTLVVPLGATEQHGPHLPLDTDTVIASRVAAALVERLREAGEDAVLAPAISFGSSGEHAAFAGTASIGAEALVTLLVELARSASAWAARTIIVNGHGGNVPVLRRVEATWNDESRRFIWCACVPPARTASGGPLELDLHAGRTETSLMRYLDPDRVRLDRIEPGDTRPASDLLPIMMRSGVHAVSANGVLGDPRESSAEEGAWLFRGMVDRIVQECVGNGSPGAQLAALEAPDAPTAPSPPATPVDRRDP